jgi:phage head maturation protease
MTDLVLQGIGTGFDKPFIHGNEIILLKAHCFDASLRENDVSLFLDHKEARLGTTANRLEVYAGKEALVFRYTLPNGSSESEVKFSEIADDFDSYIACSIGFERTKTETSTIDGVRVVTVIEGKLREISLLSCAPAVHSTYGRVVSLETCGTLAEDYDRLQLVGSYVSLHRAMKASENGGNVEYRNVTTPYERAAANFERTLKTLEYE